ncbi:gustatory and odorant receptor 24 [Diprion similis]|uniref:gustatory and odorant receptor 24 n=1 Tax=Diprion similis TaxID=362088 RepID=UPI001EF8290F|nr:gustatory and odorant receptor 24 [Diprion similis]
MSAFRATRVMPGFGMNGLIDLSGSRQGMAFMNSLGHAEKNLAPSSRIVVDAFKKKSTELQDIVYENMKAVVMVVRIMGALPIMRPYIGVTKFKFASNTMIYSVLVYVAMTAYVLYVIWNRIKIVQAVQGRFEEAVIAYLFIVFLVPNFLVPVFWYETRKNAGCFNHWMDFEIFYTRVTTRYLPINLRLRAIWISILVPVISTACVFTTQMTMDNFVLWQMVPYIYVTTFINMLGAYWYMHCTTISTCANILAQDFKHAIRSNVEAITVADYRALWLHLNRITREIGIATCYCFTVLCMYLFFSSTLSIYGLFSQLKDGITIKDLGLTMSAVSTIALLHVICDQAHSASQHVRVHFQKKLLLVELSNLNEDAQIEINMFLRATEMNPSDISLGGFFDVNRNLFKSLLGTMVTYLVVLLQFQISLPETAGVYNATLD